VSLNPAVELAVVIPTLEERGNILLVLRRLAEALEGIRYEVIFVDDDSLDGTAELIRAIANANPEVHLIQRVNRRGASSACVEGIMSTAAPYAAVMGASLQHDERILPEMLRRLRSENLDIVVGSRNVPSGSAGRSSLWQPGSVGGRLNRMICRCPIPDPLSGFFVLRQEFFMETVHRLSGIASKILLDLLASAPGRLKIGEVPYFIEEQAQGGYRHRELGRAVAYEYFQLVLDKLVGDPIPPSFVMFALVGAAGLAVYFGTFALARFGIRWGFDIAQAVAAVAAMTATFFLNNAITFRGARLKGQRLLGGLASFYAACSIGIWINLKMAHAAGALGADWYMAGIAGLGAGSIWNYGVTQMFTWREDRKRFRAAPQPANRIARAADYENSISLQALAGQLDVKEAIPAVEASLLKSGESQRV
jgi:dolichol-phosphate mannosyltransferase